MKRVLLVIALAIALWFAPSRAYAEAVYNVETENISVTGSMKQVDSHIDVLDSQDEGADIIVSFEPGSMIMVVDETDEWYTISYQGKMGYVSKKTYPDAIVDNLEFADNVQSLDEEFAEESAKTTLIAEEVERYQAERKRSIIWGSVIVILVIGVFTTGIISSLQNSKKDENKNEEDTVDEAIIEECGGNNSEEVAEIPKDENEDVQDKLDTSSWDEDLVKIEL